MKISPDGYFVIMLVLSVLLHYAFPILPLISAPYRFAGIVLLAVGFSMAWAANIVLLKKGTSIKPFQIPHVLVTGTSFKFSRNPVYLGMTFALFGVEIVLGSLSPFIFPIVFVVIIDKLFIPDEESNLEKVFGEKYRDYKARVRRWI
jgi:protein-S-isoprenylcysteine O-methyltransferase Ste14